MSEIRIDQDLDPTFSRASSGYMMDASTTVASGVVRYETISSEVGTTIEEGTVNLMTTPTSPATQDVTVTPDSDYALSFYPSSGSVTTEHKQSHDLTTGTLTGTEVSSGVLSLADEADPTFTRATTAYKNDLTTVGSGTPRYESLSGEIGVTVEESTVNILTSPTAPATQDVTVTPDSDYALSFYPSSGTVTVEHKLLETTTADFGTGTLTGVTASSDTLTLDTATADPTFTRATTATKRDLSSVSSGAARYEDIIRQALLTSQGDFDLCTKVGPIVTSPAGSVSLGRIEDGFDVDTSWAYTNSSGSVMTATFNTASSRLELSEASASNQYYTYNNFSAKNIAIEASISQSGGGGLVWRYADSSNHYFCFLYDDTASATNNVYLYKRVAGTSTLLGGPFDITFTRGTQYKFRVEMVDSIIKIYVNDTYVGGASDSAITAAGKVGFLQPSTTTTHIHSFAIDTATPLFGRNSAANNPQTGAAVTTNVPRYQLGKNLLSKNQSDVETDLTGLSTTGGGVVTRTRDIVEFWQGAASQKVVTDGAAANQGFYATSNYIPGTIPAASNVVASAYVKGGGANLTIRLDILYTDGTSNLAVSNFTDTSSWVRYSATRAGTAGKTISQVRLLMYTQGSTANTFYVDGLQIEVGSAATTWVPGGDNSILVEEGTVNILGSGSEGFSTNWAGISGASGTITSSQTDPFVGTSAYRIQTTGGTDVGKWRSIVVNPSVNGTKYSESIWVKNNSAVTVTLTTTISGGATSTITSSEGWKLMKVENVTGDGVTALQFRFNVPTSSDDLDIYVMWPQAEAKAYSTSYISPAASRSSEAFVVPSTVLGLASGAIYVEAYFDGEAINGAAASRSYRIWTVGTAGSANSLMFGRGTGAGTFFFQLVDSAATSKLANVTGWVPTVGWHKILCRWGGGNMTVFKDGASVATQTYTGALSVAEDIHIGMNSGPQEWWNQPIGEFAVFNTYPSDAECNAFTSLS